MTVEELIQQLKQYDPAATVEIEFTRNSAVMIISSPDKTWCGLDIPSYEGCSE